MKEWYEKIFRKKIREYYKAHPGVIFFTLREFLDWLKDNKQ
jgi:hypothetical protein